MRPQGKPSKPTSPACPPYRRAYHFGIIEQRIQFDLTNALSHARIEY